MTALADAIATFRRLGATYAGPARLTGESTSTKAGHRANFVLEIPKEEGAVTNPFYGLMQGQKDGQRFMLVAVMLADETAAVEGSAPPESSVAARVSAPQATAAAPEPSKDRRRLVDLPLPQRAGMLVNDRQFWEWTESRDAIAADAWLKLRCKIDSKRDLATDDEAARRFLKIEDNFRHWKNLPPIDAYAEDMR